MPQFSILKTCAVSLCLLAGAFAASEARAAEDPGIQPAGPPLRLTTDPRGAQVPAVAADRDGNFVAVWFRSVAEGSWAILARKFDSGGHPLGPEAEVDRSPFYLGRLRIAAAPDGGMIVVWAQYGVKARRLAPDGQPSGDVLSISECCDTWPDVTFLSSGDFVVVWYEEEGTAFEPLYRESVQGRIFAPDGTPRGELLEVATAHGSFPLPRVAANPAGGFAVAWQETAEQYALRVRSFNDDGTPRGPAATVASEPGFGPIPLFSPQGELSVAWTHPTPTGLYDGPGIYARRFAADGSPLGPKLLLAEGSTLSSHPDVRDDSQGHRLLIWAAPGATPESRPEIKVRVFDTAWQPSGPALAVTSFMLHRDITGHHDLPPWLAAAGGRSGFLVAWDELGSANAHPTDTLLQVSAQVLAGPCVDSDQSLCLAGARFRVGVSWHDPRGGAPGTGNALPLTGDTGAFWFFSSGNAELLIKVLDGRPVNGHWWVFFGALSDVEYDVTVTDTWTGAQQVYHNPPYTVASRADVLAFAEAPAASPAPAPVVQSSAATAVSHPGQTCAGGACIGPFEVTVDFTDPATGETHAAHGSPLGSDSSVFWFFSPDNIELIVKVLDGHAVNGHWWVFYGALSDVDYTIHVTWTEQHLTRSYHNPHGHMASRADTNAF